MNRCRSILYRLQIISNASSAVLKRVFSLCGTPRYISCLSLQISLSCIMLVWTHKAWFPHTPWLFSHNLVPITVAISVLLVTLQRNPQDFIVPIYSFSVWPPTLLTTLIYSKQNVGEYGFTDKGINLSLLNRQLNRVCTLLFFREICPTYDSQTVRVVPLINVL